MENQGQITLIVEESKMSEDKKEQDSTLNDLLATSLSNELQLWGTAVDYDHLRGMWERRITKERYMLTEQQATAINVVQACGYMMAVKRIALRDMTEIAALAKRYVALKNICDGD